MTSTTSSASTRAYTHTKAAILSGDLPGGTLVSEGDVATELGLSRTPVREAFCRLEAEGWLRLYPKRGALVVPVAESERVEVLDARLLLEGFAAERLAAAPDAPDALAARQEMRDLLAAQREAWADDDLAAFAAADAAFHRTMLEHARNSALLGFYTTLAERQQRMTRGTVEARPESAALVLAQHEALVADLEAGDVAAFRAHLREHFTSVFGPLS
ncbi:GntR family transcriptional regulator [Luteimicrobium subarcticum]|uniref:GntR family transcriptional regulator n=1 Tax=Luteimicrobium subarcticum TaxID=620910 RepID=A0A2M8WQV6_9MICO|nr:GntR family transcriptional regulator [Luteimicrobium subarcticum]PJI93322.1 GntR family transcriptional regulator [Luteimicrobium subarcticum]